MPTIGQTNLNNTPTDARPLTGAELARQRWEKRVGFVPDGCDEQGRVEAAHAASEIRPFETHKAWREQVHRHLAASLGVLVLVLALLAARRRRFGIAQVLAASLLVALAIPLYMQGQIVPALVVAGLGEALLLVAALRWSNTDLARAAALTLAVVIFQALLGKWTVTMLLKPVIVMGHLLGGMTTFALLAWTAWRATCSCARWTTTCLPWA